MKKVLLLICTMLCLCIIPCNNIYCEEENILDTWYSIKKMHIAKSYSEITDLKEDHIYEMNLNSVISNNKGLNINIYINGDKMINTSSQVNIIEQQNNPDLISAYYYVARGYEQEDESLYLLKVDMYTKYYGRNNFICNLEDKKLVFRLNDTEEIWLGKDRNGDYDVFYYPFQELNFETSSVDVDIPKGYFWPENDYTIYMNGKKFEVGPYVALNDNENPFDEYFDFSYDLKTDCIVMNIKKSFTVEPGENGVWIMGSGQFSHSNLKIIGEGEVTIEQKIDCEDSSCAAIYTDHNVIIGDEDSNLKFIYKDLIDEDYKRRRFQEEEYTVSTIFLYARTLEINNTSIQSFSTRECISTSIYDVSLKEAFVANNCNFDIVMDDINPYSCAMSLNGNAAIFNNSSLKIKDSYSAISNYSDREGLVFINTSVDIDSYSTCFSINKPIKFISDDPYINISINQRDGGNMFYWNPEDATIDNPIDISSSNKYMKYKMVKDTDDSNKILFYGPSFIFNNIENINEEDINYYFNIENGVLSITNPTKKGYDFAGWYLDEDLKVKWQNNSEVEEPYDFVLYAKWNIKQIMPSYIVPLTGIK